jgi:hypothetical protein
MSPNIWWAYDEDSQKFAALPPGPFLLPAFILCFFSYLWSSQRNQRTGMERAAGHLVDSPEWQAKHIRYLQLVKMAADCNQNISIAHWNERQRLKEYLLNPHGYQQ